MRQLGVGPGRGRHTPQLAPHPAEREHQACALRTRTGQQAPVFGALAAPAGAAAPRPADATGTTAVATVLLLHPIHPPPSVPRSLP